MRAALSAIRAALGMLLGLAVLLPAQGLAQTYRPHDFDRPENALTLEMGLDAREAFDAFGTRPNRPSRLGKEDRKPDSWRLFGRLSLLSVEARSGAPDDGFTFKRSSGPKLGRLTIGIRRQF
jgi:hypothetical protein